MVDVSVGRKVHDEDGFPIGTIVSFAAVERELGSGVIPDGTVPIEVQGATGSYLFVTPEGLGRASAH